MTPNQKWRANNRDKTKVIAKRYYENNREKILEYGREYRKRNKKLIAARPSESKESQREHHLKYKYNLSVEEYDKMLADQGGVCAICGGTKHKFCVDHNHNTGQVRGILCLLCNSALGKFQDNPEILQKAIKYIYDTK